MSDLWPVALVGFAISLGLTPLTRQLARRIGLLDKPGGRKIHGTPMPLMGGLAIYGAFVVALLLFPHWPQYLLELSTILVGATWLAVIGLIDDRRNLSPWIKFPAQFLAAGSVIASGVRVDVIHVPALDVLLTFVWIVGIINATNFLDNMDGLAAGLSAIAAGFFFILAVSQGQELVAALSAALCGSAIGFLIYNFNPATTFMGDMGALVLGFVLAVLGIKLHFFHQSLAVSWLIPVLVLGLPLFDTSLVVFTRLREGRSPVRGAKDHTSHRLAVLGFSQRQAVVTQYVICAMLGIAAIVVSQADVAIGQAIGIGVALIGLCAFVGLEIVRWRQLKREKLAQAEQPQPSTDFATTTNTKG
ncbi:MAG: glycosyltransferase family 4 protein [Aggregatilineales bacterium]